MSAPDLDLIDSVARVLLIPLLEELLPGGRRCGDEWIAIYVCRGSEGLGCLQFDLVTGRWVDTFRLDARGHGVISLAAHLTGSSKVAAARALAKRLGVS